MIVGLGELAGLGAALFWAVSSMIWGRIPLTALGINLAKNVLGAAILFLHLLVLAIVLNRPLVAADIDSWKWLALSGLIGIALGDTFYFRSLQTLGPRKSLMVASSAPIFAALLNWWVLKNTVLPLGMLGIGLVILGVVLVVADRKAKKEFAHLQSGEYFRGIIFGILGALCQALGLLFSQFGMQNCGALEASFIRILVSATMIVCSYIAIGKFKPVAKKIIERKNIIWILPATAMGTWLGIWFSQVAVKHADLATAQTLMATSPLFAIPMAILFYRERPTLVSFLGTVIGIAGIYFVVSNHMS
ncbi:MAG: DMT family transporter [Pirellulaceae bacterium]